jgi:hypothetical protein
MYAHTHTHTHTHTHAHRSQVMVRADPGGRTLPKVSHCCSTVVTLLSHCCHTVVPLLLHCCYTVVTLLLHCGYTVVFCCYTVVTLWLHCCYTVVTLWLHCGYTVVTLLLHCRHNCFTCYIHTLRATKKWTCWCHPRAVAVARSCTTSARRRRCVAFSRVWESYYENELKTKYTHRAKQVQSPPQDGTPIKGGQYVKDSFSPVEQKQA